jgi:hypothetical protein
LSVAAAELKRSVASEFRSECSRETDRNGRRLPSFLGRDFTCNALRGPTVGRPPFRSTTVLAPVAGLGAGVGCNLGGAGPNLAEGVAEIRSSRAAEPFAESRRP